MVQPYFDQKCLYPIGFTSTVEDKSFIEKNKTVTYTQSILDGGYSPKFQIVASDAVNDPVTESTANAAWTIMMRRIVMCQANDELLQKIKEEDITLAAEKKAMEEALVLAEMEDGDDDAGTSGTTTSSSSSSSSSSPQEKISSGRTASGIKKIASPFRKTNSKITVPIGNLRFGLSIPHVVFMLEGLDGISEIGKQYKLGLLRRAKGSKKRKKKSDNNVDKIDATKSKKSKSENSLLVGASGAAGAAGAVGAAGDDAAKKESPTKKRSRSEENLNQSPEPNSTKKRAKKSAQKATQSTTIPEVPVVVENAMASPPAEQPQEMASEFDSPAMLSDEPSPTNEIVDLVEDNDNVADEVASSSSSGSQKRKADPEMKSNNKDIKRSKSDSKKQAGLMGFFKKKPVGN